MDKRKSSAERPVAVKEKVVDAKPPATLQKQITSNIIKGDAYTTKGVDPLGVKADNRSTLQEIPVPKSASTPSKKDEDPDTITIVSDNETLEQDDTTATGRNEGEWIERKGKKHPRHNSWHKPSGKHEGISSKSLVRALDHITCQLPENSLKEVILSPLGRVRDDQMSGERPPS